MPKRSTTEDPLRKVWTSLESFIARMEVLERRVDDARSPHHHDVPRALPNNHYPCSSSPDISLTLSGENYMLLIKTIQAACCRLSVLEAKMNISYDGTFKPTIEQGHYFVKG